MIWMPVIYKQESSVQLLMFSGIYTMNFRHITFNLVRVLHSKASVNWILVLPMYNSSNCEFLNDFGIVLSY